MSNRCGNETVHRSALSKLHRAVWTFRAIHVGLVGAMLFASAAHDVPALGILILLAVLNYLVQNAGLLAIQLCPGQFEYRADLILQCADLILGATPQTKNELEQYNWLATALRMPVPVRVIEAVRDWLKTCTP